MRKHFDLFIFGKVQGVNFRYTVKQYADKYKIRGYVRNLKNKSVFMEIEGENKSLQKFIKWLNSGEVGFANISKTEFTLGSIKGFREFQIF